MRSEYVFDLLYRLLLASSSSPHIPTITLRLSGLLRPCSLTQRTQRYPNDVCPVTTSTMGQFTAIEYEFYVSWHNDASHESRNSIDYPVSLFAWHRGSNKWKFFADWVKCIYNACIEQTLKALNNFFQSAELVHLLLFLMCIMYHCFIWVVQMWPLTQLENRWMGPLKYTYQTILFFLNHLLTFISNVRSFISMVTAKRII